ncbi:MAG TPA: phosphoribosylanthranilate isomerase [Steroidobacteraceae bacterium]|nr:phosphoribosylanthranilate isomerase [Steroidobacteraceae bacterium]
MSWIKICGLTTDEGVRAALDAQVDAVGFVFTSSVRQLSPQAAARLAAPARGRALCVAVGQHVSQSLLDAIVAVFEPDALQVDAGELDSLALPRGLELLPVLRTGQSPPEPLPPRLLYEGAVSGTGQRFDWSGAAPLARRTELILAGGLNEANVAEAIREVRPFGVDVSSGVEARPGVKSPEKIRAFVRNARAAEETVT